MIARCLVAVVLGTSVGLLWASGAARADGAAYTCAAGWTDLGSGAYGDCEYDSATTYPTWAAAVAALPDMSGQASRYDLLVSLRGSGGATRGYTKPAYTGDGATGDPGEYSHNVAPTDGPWHLHFEDLGQDYGDGGPGLYPNPATQTALAAFTVGGTWSDPASDSGGGGGSDPVTSTLTGIVAPIKNELLLAGGIALAVAVSVFALRAGWKYFKRLTGEGVGGGSDWVSPEREYENWGMDTSGSTLTGDQLHRYQGEA
jgi:hypothetical protein